MSISTNEMTAEFGPVGNNSTDTTYKTPLAIITSLFFMFGFLTCLNDILVPHLKALFTLNYAQATLVQFCFFSAYFFMSVPSGKIVKKMGYQKGVVIGLCVTAIGTLGFLPSAGMRSYPLFLTSLFVLASGITLIQVAANPYVTLLGKPETASGRLNLVQAFNSLGTTIAPSIGAIFILSRAQDNADASSIQRPYFVLTILLAMLAVFMMVVKLPKIQTDENHENKKFRFFEHKGLVLGALGIFTYVGAEVAIGSFLISWMGSEQLGSLDHVTAGKYVSFYWGAAMVGRFVGTYFLMKFSAPKVLRIFSIGAIALTIASVLSSGHLSMTTILLVGFFNSIMFPTIFSLSLRGLSQYTAEASGILCMAIVGGAVVPLLQGITADHFGLQWSFIIPIVCYFYILYFSGLRTLSQK